MYNHVLPQTEYEQTPRWQTTSVGTWVAMLHLAIVPSYMLHNASLLRGLHEQTRRKQRITTKQASTRCPSKQTTIKVKYKWMKTRKIEFINSYSASRDNWCTVGGDGDVGSAR